MIGGMGQYSAAPISLYQPIDPLLDSAINASVQLLKTKDPNVVETGQLVRRIIVAPGFGTGPTAAGELSSVNGMLSAIATFREHSVAISLLLLSVPALAFLAGRAIGLRSSEG